MPPPTADLCVLADSAVLPEGPGARTTLSPGPVAVYISQGVIVALECVASLDGFAPTCPTMRTPLLLPGCVDLHTHGVGGADDLADFWLNPEYTASRVPALGTTSFLASVVFGTDAEEGTRRVVAAISALAGATGHGAVCEGIHAEGPVVADFGGLPQTELPSMPLSRFDALVDSMLPHLKVMTISPSLDSAEGYPRLSKLLAVGVLPALGHDRGCTEADILGALRVAAVAGVRCHVTHLFNVSSFHHRSPSLSNFGLVRTMPSLPAYSGLLPPTVEVIADCAHVHPLALQLLFESRAAAGDVACVTDSVMEPVPGAECCYNDRRIKVSADGRAVLLKGTDTLAGSCCGLLDAFRTVVNVLGRGVAEASDAVAASPAAIAGLGHVGLIAVGRRADLLLVGPGPEFALSATLVAGKVVFGAPVAEGGGESMLRCEPCADPIT